MCLDLEQLHSCIHDLFVQLYSLDVAVVRL